MSAGQHVHRYQWVARYEDDAAGLPQFNPDGTENKYADIDRARLTGLWLLGEDRRLFFYQHVPAGWGLIHRRRVIVAGDARTVVHLVGVQKTVAGQNHQMVCALFEDGHVEGMPRHLGDHAVWGAPQFLPGEA